MQSLDIQNPGMPDLQFVLFVTALCTADLNTINAALKQNPDLLDAQMKQKLGDVRFNLSLLARDGSRGSHNIDLTAEIFSNASKDLRAIRNAAGAGPTQSK